LNQPVGRTPTTLPYWTAPALGFAAFGGLVGWRMGPTALAAAVGVAGGAVFAVVAASLLVFVLGLANPNLGREALREAAETGFLLILPFAALALAAELALGWQASQVFSSAALMTSGGAVGMEVARRGGGALRSALVPSAVALLLSAAWVVLSTFAASNWKW
jgi:hypothetical protein